MAFYTPTESIIITDLDDDTSALLDATPQEADSGWDSMIQTYLLRDVSAGRDPVLAVSGRFMRGTQVSGLNMWIQARTTTCLARGLFRVQVSSKGILSSRGYKVTYDGAANTSNVENVNYDGTLNPKMAVDEAGVTAQLEYLLIGTPPTGIVGTSSTPPGGWVPAVRASPWTSLENPTRHYPSGWICKRVGADNLPGLNVWIVREGYLYQDEYTP